MAGAAMMAATASVEAKKGDGLTAHVEPDAFRNILQRQQGLLVVHATVRLFGKRIST